MKASILEWGLKDETIEAPALWGARLIFNEPSSDPYARPVIELLWDRQSIQADPGVSTAELVAKLDGPPTRTGTHRSSGAIHALIAFLTHEANHYRIERTSTARFDRTLKGVRFRGTPNGSHGYIYVTATLDDTPTCDGCGTGGVHKGTAKFPGICVKCRDEHKVIERAKAKLEREANKFPSQRRAR